MLIYFMLLTLAGLSSALWPSRRARAVEKRMLEGDDRYFEEQRSYRSYPWLRDPRRIRVIGIITTVIGLIACVVIVYRG